MSGNPMRARVYGLGAATLMRGAYLAIQGGASLATFAVMARLLDSNELGAASAALALAVTSQVFADLGLSQVVTLEIPSAAEGGTDLAAAAARTFLKLSVVGMALVAALSVMLPESAVLPGLAVAPSAGAAVVVTGAESIARAKGDAARPVIFAACSRLLFFPLVPLILLAPTATTATVVYSGATLVGAIPALIALRRTAITNSDVSSRSLLRTAVHLGVASALIAVATRVNVIVLAGVDSLTAAGRFDGAWRACQPFLYFAGMLGTAATPFAARAAARGEGLARLIAPGAAAAGTAGLLGGAGLALATEQVSIVVYGGPNEEVESALRWIAFALPPSLIAYYLQSTILIAERRYRAIGLSAAVMCVVCLSGTAVLGSAHGPAGAAAALALSQVVYLACIVVGLLERRRRRATR